MAMRTVSTLGKRLGVSSRETAVYVALEDEAAVILAIQRPAFRPDSRWLASVAGITVDRVNISLQTLLRCGRLRMLSRQQWLIVKEGFE
jgi:hypothetical protein